MSILETRSSGDAPSLKMAVIDTGISGLSAARLLSQRHDVSVFEAADRVGVQQCCRIRWRGGAYCGRGGSVAMNRLDEVDGLSVKPAARHGVGVRATQPGPEASIIVRHMLYSIRSFCILTACLAISMLGFLHPSAAEDASTKPVRIDVGDIKLNSILVPAGKHADLPPIVFVHGASTSLYDPMFSFRTKLEGRAELLFVDRPGHGNSDFGGKNYIFPDVQADAIARLMKQRGIRRAIVVGHSFGGAIAAELAVRHPEMVSGLVFLSPAVYPWKGGVAWYYEAASKPISGDLFSTFVVPALGLLAIDSATKSVFEPNPRPAGYVTATRALDALRPRTFKRNAEEISALSDWAKTGAKGYRSIKAPTVVITGDADGVVSPTVHAEHLARDIRGARLLVVHDLGHKSDYIANDLAIGAIEHVAGRPVNLIALRNTLQKHLLKVDTKS